jgi:hypothetical protein
MYPLTHICLQTFLAILVIGPWIIALAYDIILWVVRAIYFEIPVIGGRATGQRPPPRRPQLVQEVADGATEVMEKTAEVAEKKIGEIKDLHGDAVRRRNEKTGGDGGG